MPDIDVEVFIKAAVRHGEDSEPDHEVGDLQDYLRAAFRLLTPEQKVAFLADPAVSEALTTACPNVDWDGRDPMQAYTDVAASLQDDATTAPRGI